MAKHPTSEPVLIAIEDPAWTVHQDGDTCELRYKGKPQHRLKYEHGRARLVDMAALFNRNAAVPKSSRQCVADEPTPKKRRGSTAPGQAEFSMDFHTADS